MNEQLRQQLAAQWMWKSVESGMEQLLNEKAALERALAEALQNPAQDSMQNIPVQNIQAPPPQRKYRAKRRSKAALCQAGMKAHPYSNRFHQPT